MELDVCVGFPHFTGDYKDIGIQTEEVVTEDDEDDELYSVVDNQPLLV